MNPPILSKAERTQQGKLAEKCNKVFQCFSTQMIDPLKKPLTKHHHRHDPTLQL